MKLNLRQLPKPAPVPEFIFTEQEARHLRDLIGNVSFADFCEMTGTEFGNSEEREKMSWLHYRIYDELFAALTSLE